tara:strand:+ start:3290 stop:6250 length:2961 start_codon:yes stop_codon:yes gene_type:complete
MSEFLLRALMQLFALASSRDDLNENSRKVVEASLSTELSAELVKTYLDLYDQYIADFIARRQKSTPGTIDRQLIENVCKDLTQDLESRQKTVVILRLLEYIFADGNVSKHEISFLQVVSKTLHVRKETYDKCFAFATAETEQLPDLNEFLVLSPKEASYEHSKFELNQDLDAPCIFVYLKHVNLFAVRYFGKQNLNINGRIIRSGRIYILSQGASIRSTKLSPIYYSDLIARFLEDEHRSKLILKVENVTYQFNERNVAIHPITFAERHGRLMGIMGSSGAGKSTLLNILNGNITPTSGKVTLNGFDVHQEKSRIKGLIGYVSQDDLLIEELTVFQNLYYNAQLCFGHLNNNEIETLTNDLLLTIGLSDIKDLQVGNPLNKKISGGQRKRLNIALELIREPSILFIDEPTSGLSSRDSENVIDLLKQLTLRGKIVVAVIHQPSSDVFKMLDRLLIIDQGGYPIYYGYPIDALPYFRAIVQHANLQESECHTCGNVNTEQIFNIIEANVLDEFGRPTGHRKTQPDEWYNKYLENGGNVIPAKRKVEVTTIPHSNLDPPNVFEQFYIFLKRDVFSKITDRQYLLITLLEAPVLAILLSYFIKYSALTPEGISDYSFASNENIPAFLFMNVVVALFIGLIISAEEIIKDKKQRKRETFLNLSKGAYLNSKLLTLFSISAIQMLSFVLISQSIIEIKGMFWSYFAVLFSIACFANVLGLNISSAFRSIVSVYILIPFLIIPQLIFSGAIVKFDKLNPKISSQAHVPFIGEIMASRWAFEALTTHQFKSNEWSTIFYPIDQKISQIGFEKNELMPELQLLSADTSKEAKTLLEKEVSNMLGTDYKVTNKEQVLSELTVYKNGLNKEYIQLLNLRDQLLDSLEESGVDLAKMKAQNVNQQLSSLVKNSDGLTKIIRIDGDFIRYTDPIYNPAKVFRAHFYAPKKQILGFSVDTLWYNLGVIGIMTILLMVALYYDLLQKLVLFLEQLRKFRS